VSDSGTRINGEVIHSDGTVGGPAEPWAPKVHPDRLTGVSSSEDRDREIERIEYGLDGHNMLSTGLCDCGDHERTPDYRDTVTFNRHVAAALDDAGLRVRQDTPGLREALVARAIHDYAHLDDEKECDAPIDAREILRRHDEYRAALARQDTETPEHPEDHCQRCGRANVSWFAPSPLWNEVMGGEAGIVCPVCFAQLATERGIDTTWRFEPETRPYAALSETRHDSGSDRISVWDQGYDEGYRAGQNAAKTSGIDAERLARALEWVAFNFGLEHRHIAWGNFADQLLARLSEGVSERQTDG
jgi:hypothetical protein